MMEIFKKLYESEINFRLESAWDMGYYFQFGDFQNGYAELYHAGSKDLDELAHEIARKACEFYPFSDFKKWYDEQVQIQG